MRASVVSPPADWTPYPSQTTVVDDWWWEDHATLWTPAHPDPTGDTAVRRVERRGRPHKAMRGRR